MLYTTTNHRRVCTVNEIAYSTHYFVFFAHFCDVPFLGFGFHLFAKSFIGCSIVPEQDYTV